MVLHTQALQRTFHNHGKNLKRTCLRGCLRCIEERITLFFAVWNIALTSCINVCCTWNNRKKIPVCMDICMCHGTAGKNTNCLFRLEVDVLTLCMILIAEIDDWRTVTLCWHQPPKLAGKVQPEVPEAQSAESSGECERWRQWFLFLHKFLWMLLLVIHYPLRKQSAGQGKKRMKDTES